MSACPDENTLQAVLGGCLPAERLAEVNLHIEVCSRCMSVLLLLRGSLAGALPPPEVLAAPPSRVGPYRIERALGQGGMSTVYLAQQEPLGRRVALKVLHPNLARDAQVRARFLNEARTLCRIRHPSLVLVSDFGQMPDGRPFLVMEYLEGAPLRQRFQDATDVLGALRLLRQVAAALCAVHAAGVIHRDLKPDNVMITPDPEAPAGERAKVVDFGLAKLARVPGDAGLQSGAYARLGALAPPPSVGTEAARPPVESIAGALLGTPLYMAPEQCQAHGAITDRTDVYAMGVMLYELLTGAPPFRGPSLAHILTQHVQASPPPLDERCPHASAALRRLIHAMLRKVPSERPSMAAVGAALDQIVRRGSWQHTPLRRRLRVALALLLPTAALGSVGLWLLSRSPHPGMVHLPGGAFTMGSSEREIAAGLLFCQRLGGGEGCQRDFYQREAPQRRVQVSSFWLDRSEVTNERFVDWLNRQAGLRIKDQRRVFFGDTLLVDLYPSYGYAGIAHDGARFVVRPGMALRPVLQVSWAAARRSCAAWGGRLPTEAEWEYAARGGSAQRRFPWGEDLPRCEGVVYARIAGRQCAHLPTWLPEVGQASQDRSLHGVLDLGGSVSEWVEDGMVAPYPPCPGGECRDPRSEPPVGARPFRVVRGGSWNMLAESSRTSTRIRWEEDQVSGNIGFRCAASAAR